MAGFEVPPHGRFCTDPRGLLLGRSLPPFQPLAVTRFKQSESRSYGGSILRYPARRDSRRKVSTASFSQSQWDAAKHEVRDLLIERARVRGMIPYSELAGQIRS